MSLIYDFQSRTSEFIQEPMKKTEEYLERLKKEIEYSRRVKKTKF
jgi:hypothetical protein